MQEVQLVGFWIFLINSLLIELAYTLYRQICNISFIAKHCVNTFTYLNVIPTNL